MEKLSGSPGSEEVLLPIRLVFCKVARNSSGEGRWRRKSGRDWRNSKMDGEMSHCSVWKTNQSYDTVYQKFLTRRQWLNRVMHNEGLSLSRL